VLLDQISASTKISVSLLKGLENGDLSRWPKGLYCRSYVRDYLRAVSLPIDSNLAEFLRIFPDEGGSSVDEVLDADGHRVSVLSLTLADDRLEHAARTGRRLLAASIDGVIVLAASGTAAWLIPADFWMCAALLALGYYSIATASLGRTLGSYWCVDRSRKRWKQTTASTDDPDTLLKRIRRLRELSAGPSRSTVREIGRLSWNAALVRIWTAIRP
jgi:hypothetical protein